jgi:hypothetical protein
MGKGTEGSNVCVKRSKKTTENSVRVVGIADEVRTRDIQNTEQECALMMEAARPTEVLINSYKSTRRYNPEDSHLRTHRFGNLK